MPSLQLSTGRASSHHSFLWCCCIILSQLALFFEPRSISRLVACWRRGFYAYCGPSTLVGNFIRGLQIRLARFATKAGQYEASIVGVNSRLWFYVIVRNSAPTLQYTTKQHNNTTIQKHYKPTKQQHKTATQQHNTIIIQQNSTTQTVQAKHTIKHTTTKQNQHTQQHYTTTQQHNKTTKQHNSTTQQHNEHHNKTTHKSTTAQRNETTTPHNTTQLNNKATQRNIKQ